MPVGSGTVVSPDGLILTNWHVVDMAAHRAQLDAWEAQAASDGESPTLRPRRGPRLVSGHRGVSAPEPVYMADVVAEDHALDLAVLRVTGDEVGTPLSDPPALPFVPLGDSSAVRQGDPVDVFGYPMIGGSRCLHEWGGERLQLRGGDRGSGLDHHQRHDVGWQQRGDRPRPRRAAHRRADAGHQLDCRPGDTNRDGTIDADDVGVFRPGDPLASCGPSAAHRFFHQPAGVALAHVLRALGPQPAVVAAVIAVQLLFFLVAGQFRGAHVDDNHVIARIDVRRVDRLVLSLQQMRGQASHAPERKRGGINHVPLALDLPGCWNERTGQIPF